MNPIRAVFFSVMPFLLVGLLLLGGIVLVVVLVLALIRAFGKKDQPQPPPQPAIASTLVLPQRKCPQCGAELKLDAPEGLCPACLLKRGIATEGGTPPGTPPFTPPPPAELAKLFPQLEILEPIGQGGMGAVYKARQPTLDRLVALKILAPRSGGDVDFAERFTREARALAKLSHPNIVAVYDFGQINVGQASRLPGERESTSNESQTAPPTSSVGPGKMPALHYFIMEYVDGLNLRQIEQAGKLRPHEALQIIPQICAALQFAHDEGIVHRDIKPENILLDKKGRVKIADFGLAKIVGLEAKDFRLTGARDVMGTPHYMAPEQVEHPQAVDHRADIYSLGVVFYEMLTGELPLGKFAPPSKKVHVDVRLDEVVLRSLEKEPSRRYQHAGEVKTDVETISSSRPDSKPGARRKKPILPLMLGAGIICVLLVAALFLFRGKPVQTLTIRAFIDGSDVINISGHKLWIEHDTGVLPGKTIYINGQAWTPTWTNNVSSTFEAVNPAFQPHDPQTIHITRHAGRGIVSIEQFPTADNGQTLAVRINDDDFGGADWYDLVISWNGRPKSGSGNASQLTQQGWQLWQSQKLDEAAAKFREAVKLAPDNANAWNGLGWATFNAGNTSEAEEAFQKAISIEPTQPGALNGLGQIYLSRGKYDQAETYLLKAAPRAPAAWYGLTRIYLLEGKFAQAEKWAQQIVDSGQANDLVRQMLKAAQEKHLSQGLRVMIEPASAANSMDAASIGSNAQSAMPAIQAWLKLMDDGDYGQSWEEAADSFHTAITKAEWVAKSKEIREPLGKVLSRKLSSTEQPTTIPGMPYRSYFVAKFHTAFANFKPATETVTFALTDDGQWKAIAYLILPGASAETPAVATIAGKQAALSAVQAWLKLMDNGDYAKSWEEAADSFHAAVTKTDWVAKSMEIRHPLGKVLSRKLSSTEQPKTIPGMPYRSYFVAKFDTAFANFKPATETVTFALTGDGKWKAIAYLIQPGTNEKEPEIGSSEKPAITTDQVLVEHAAMHVLAAIRDQDDATLKKYATDDCVKGWRDSLPEFAFELREKFHQFTGKPFDLHVSESQVRGDKALVKCDGPAALDGKYLALFFVKTADGWKNCYLHNGLPPTRLGDWWTQFPGKKSSVAEAKAEDAAVSAAKKWLALIDAGNYSESWRGAAAYFRGAVTESSWENSMNSFRKPLGDLLSRKLKSAEHLTQAPGAPDGQYVLVQFDTSFANKKSAVETVTFMQEKDGQWKAAGYFIK